MKTTPTSCVQRLQKESSSGYHITALCLHVTQTFVHSMWQVMLYNIKSPQQSLGHIKKKKSLGSPSAAFLKAVDTIGNYSKYLSA